MACKRIDRALHRADFGLQCVDLSRGLLILIRFAFDVAKQIRSVADKALVIELPFVRWIVRTFLHDDFVESVKVELSNEAAKVGRFVIFGQNFFGETCLVHNHEGMSVVRPTHEIRGTRFDYFYELCIYACVRVIRKDRGRVSSSQVYYIDDCFAEEHDGGSRTLGVRSFDLYLPFARRRVQSRSDPSNFLGSSFSSTLSLSFSLFCLLFYFISEKTFLSFLFSLVAFTGPFSFLFSPLSENPTLLTKTTNVRRLSTHTLHAVRTVFYLCK